jgi:hypothetical protein
MCRIAESQGIKCYKDWVFDKDWGTTNGRSSLHPMGSNGKPVLFPSEEGIREPVQWVYHVAPLVQVQQADGSITPMVLDPSIAKSPLTREQWRRIQNAPQDVQNYITEGDVFFYDPLEKSADTASPQQVAEVFEDHRASRDTALAAERARK